MKKSLLLLILPAIFLVACQPAVAPGTGAGPGDVLTQVSLPVGYIPNVQFAPLYVAMEKGYFKDAGLEVNIDYSYETDAMALVGADKLQFALVSGEQVLLARAQQLPVVFSMAWYKDYPVGIASMVDAEIETPADLKGKTIGVPVLSGASYVGLQALLAAGGLKESDVTLEVIGFTQVESLATGQVDAVVVYVANEPVQLKAQGYDIRVLKVSDYLGLVSNGLLTNEKTIAENPQLVARMTSAILRGITYAADHPDEAYEICKKYVANLSEADQSIQEAVLAESIKLWQTGNPGYSDPAGWENMQRVLLGMGSIQQPLDLSAAYTNQFVQQP